MVGPQESKNNNKNNYDDILLFRRGLGTKEMIIVDPFSEGGWCAGKQIGSYKTCLPCKIAEMF